MRHRSVFAALALAACVAPSLAQPAHIYSGSGFTIAYPDGWRVDPDFKDRGYGYFQGDHEDMRSGVAFRPTVDLAPGTSLQSDQLVLAVEPARPADRCAAGAFLMDSSPDTPTARLIDKPDVVRTIAQAGDLYAIEHIVLIASHEPCLAVHYIITFRSGPGSPPPFDHDKLVALLNAMAGTLKPQHSQ